jgi:serine O-acetyltransferase
VHILTDTVQDNRHTLNTTPDWPIEEVIKGLSAVRRQSLEARNRLQKPTILPSREALSRIVEKLALIMFPNRLGNRVLAPTSIDYVVGQLLDVTLNELLHQVEIELKFSNHDDVEDQVARNQAIEHVRSFAQQLPQIRVLLDLDLKAAFEGDPAAKSLDEVLACYPGVFALLHYRIANAIFIRGLTLTARIISEIAHSKTGIDIHPGASIDEAFFIDHGTGVVIGETAVIGKRVRLYHGVTLGAKVCEHTEQVSRNTSERRHPVVEDDVVIYANATILGNVTVGTQSIIGGNVWITEDIPSKARVSQAKALMGTFADGEGI